MPRKITPHQPIQIWIVKTGEKIMGTFHSDDEAKKYVKRFGGVVTFGPLEEAERVWKEQRNG
jgi:hypothetical protein